MSAATKTRALTLRPHEARRLHEAGRVLVVREVEPQPHPSCSEGGTGWHWHSAGRDDHYTFGTDERHLMESMASDGGPFGPVGGQLVAVAPDGGESTATVLAVRVGILGSASEDECRATGVDPVMVDTGGSTPWGEWIEVPDWYEPLAGSMGFPADDRWCWFATIEDASREGVAK